MEALQKALSGPCVTSQADLALKHLGSGKVREIFDAGDDHHLLIVATDRLSAFDVILPTGIPGKGVLLTQISLWWFARAAAVMPHHLADDHDARLRALLDQIGGSDCFERSMLVRRLEPLPLEAVVRGYLAGSAWKDYQQNGAVQGHALPQDLREASKLPEPLFTPTTKAQAGHDQPLTQAEARALVGDATFDTVKRASLALFQLGAQAADACGLILADTKFEFGRDADGSLHLIDEVLTPDSSRYWPRDGYTPGRAQPAFDKQYVRDYLEGLDWDKTAPGPDLPPSVVQRTQERYLETCRRLMDPSVRA
ncbi:MAG: phosphoribosylaminoimidazolesuccinocarboxamide synthase [Opitutales bacterium]